MFVFDIIKSIDHGFPTDMKEQATSDSVTKLTKLL
jgi:hypothetical protein